MKKIFLGFVALFLGIYLFSLLYVGIHTEDNTAKPSDAILVLGAKSQYKNKVNPCLLARVEKGVFLYKKGFANKVIMSGGNDGFDKDNQAILMGSLAQKEDVPKENIYLEKKSATTYENLLYTRTLLRKNNLTSVIIVSDPYHLARAELIAKSLHMTYTVSPATESPCWTTYRFLGFDYFRDALALLQYILTGKISFSSLTR